MSLVGKQFVTAEQLLSMRGPGRRELIAGEVREMTPAGHMHGRIANNLSFLLSAHVRRAELGLVYAAETGFLIAREPDTVRAPDVAFVGRDRAVADAPGYFPGAPDLAVEVVSPDDRVQDLEEKTQAWLAAGTKLVWVVWPNTRTVSVHRPGAPVATLREDEELDGGDVVPGFACRVGDVFAK